MLRSGFVGRLIVLGVGVVLLPVLRAAAATPATMTIESASSAASSGSKGSKANKQPKGAAAENQIDLLSVSRPGSDATASADSGGARKTSGTGSTSSLIVTKAYDSTSAQLEEAEATNEFLHQVIITFPPSATGNGKGSVTGSTPKKIKGGQANNKGSQANSPDAAGQAIKTAQVLVLTNAQVTSIEQTRNIQKITIEYQSIEVTFTSGKTAVSDDWDTP